ncbi:adenylate kinase 9-like [Photinus pyralis]|nr:adenylate kinase 9-like [Photinus pyralis]
MTDFYLNESNNLSQYKCDQTIIINEKYLKEIWRFHSECEPKREPIDWYPLANSYYPRTEDVDACARVGHLLSTERDATFAPETACDCSCEEDCYSERSAQIKYFSAEPAAFLIIGKPELGGEQLGRLLADHWRCVYVEPENLIAEEIAGRTRAGVAIEYNLRVGRAIGAGTVLRLIAKRLGTETVKHRGYVLCGLPLVPNGLFHQEALSDDSTIFDVRNVLDEILANVDQLGVPPASKHKLLQFEIEDPPPDFGGADLGSEDGDDVCSTFGEDQLEFIFRRLHKSSVVIYMACPNGDVIRKRAGYRLDVDTNQTVDSQQELNEKMIYTHFSQTPGVANDEELPEDFIDVVKDSRMVFGRSQGRLLVRTPQNFPSNVSATLDRFRQSAMPEIERFVLAHDPQLVIRVDGRISVVRMFYAVKMKLETLPLQRVAVPELCLASSETPGEAGPADGLNIDGLTVEECFALFSRRNVASSMFKWGWSDWGCKCPVSMVDGYEIRGDPNYAVHFMSNIFFLANQEACARFQRNPRPFLLPPWPKPTCRIYVMGPRLSGRTSVANCLGYVFKAAVLNYDQLMHSCFTARLNEYRNGIRSKALEHALGVLNAQRQGEWDELERERALKIDEWAFGQREAIKQLIRLRRDIAELESQTAFFPVSSFPLQLSYSKTVESSDGNARTSVSTLPLAKLKEMANELERTMGVPPLSDYEELLHDVDQLYKYLPEHLRQPTEAVVPASESDEPVRLYVEEALRSASYDHLEMTMEHKVEVLTRSIKEIEDRNRSRGGWIVDGVQPIPQLFQELNPDYTPTFIILLADGHEILLERFPKRGQNEFRDFRGLFHEIEKEEAAWRSPSVTSTVSYRERNMKRVVDEILDEIDDGRLENIVAYTRDLHQFDVDFAGLRPKLVEFGIDVLPVTVSPSLKDTLKEAVRLVENRYRRPASEYTELDRAEEVQDLGGGLEPEEKEDGPDDILANRRYGDTFHYCPVAFAEHRVLWRGKEEFAAKFQDKVYTFADRSALDAFVGDPYRYLPPRRAKIPPPRVCVVGPRASGKYALADRLCRNFGLCRHQFANLDRALGALWTSERERVFGFVLSGFPRRLADLSFMLEHHAIPDLVIELAADKNEVRERLLARFGGLGEDEFESFVNEVEDSFAKELEDLQETRERCRLEQIPWVTVDSFTQAARVVDGLKFRNESAFERVYEVSVDLSERLLSSGYYFLSRFGRWCPVDGSSPVQMYLKSKETYQLTPCIHRQYVYFIARKSDVEKFKANPLRYTSQAGHVPKAQVPFRLAIVGSPRSGKTSLAERFRRELGLQVVTRGKAGRYVLNYLRFSQLAESMDSVLRFGWQLSEECAMRAVEAISFDSKCVTLGMVMDGFPESRTEVRALATAGLVPHLVINLNADLPVVSEFRGSAGKRGLPPFSERFISHRYHQVKMLEPIFQEWFQSEYQVLKTIQVGPSRWRAWNQSRDLAMDAFSQVQHYFSHASADTPLHLAHMLVTPLEFIERQSGYKNYCPCCLYFDNCLIDGGSPPDRTRLLQFREYFYFICSSHTEHFLGDPLRFISPYNPRQLPDQVPVRPAHIPQGNPYSEGNCIVCYTQNLPRHVIHPGSRLLTVVYREKIYRFDTEPCLQTFMREPHLFFSKVINYDDPLPALRPQDLPIPGYLQQDDAHQLVRAINNTRILRPVIPGLSVEQSAALNVGFHLKVNNPKTTERFLPLYAEARETFNRRRLSLLRRLDEMKRMINPYLYYEEPMPKFVDPLADSSRASSVPTSKVFDEHDIN